MASPVGRDGRALRSVSPPLITSGDSPDTEAGTTDAKGLDTRENNLLCSGGASAAEGDRPPAGHCSRSRTLAEGSDAAHAGCAVWTRPYRPEVLRDPAASATGFILEEGVGGDDHAGVR